MNLFSVRRAWEICRPQAQNHWSTSLCAITCHVCKLLPSETNSMVLYNAQPICLPKGKSILLFPVPTVFTAFCSKWQQVTFRVCTSYSSVENSLTIKLSARAPEIAFGRSITKSQSPLSQNRLFISIIFLHTSNFTEFNRAAHDHTVSTCFPFLWDLVIFSSLTLYFSQELLQSIIIFQIINSSSNKEALKVLPEISRQVLEERSKILKKKIVLKGVSLLSDCHIVKYL